MSNTIQINNQDHDLAELRQNAQEGLESFEADALAMAFNVMGPEYLASAMRGMMHTILALLDEVEQHRAAA